MSRFNSRSWLKIASLPSTIECPDMRLLGRMGETLVQGSGKLILNDFGDFLFEIEGKTEVREELLRFVLQQRSDQYDGLGRFRLAVTDVDGQELHCGFAETDEFHANDEAVVCDGHAEGLSSYTPHLGGVGTEILFLVPKRHWLGDVLSVSFPNSDEHGISHYSMDIEGSPIEFEYEAATRSLTISVSGNETFPQTYTEGWLGEPMRMLLGQLAFPRIIVRSNPDRAMIMVSQIRHWHLNGDEYSLFDPATSLDDPQAFFRMYGELLKYVANARTEEGNLNFERNPLTLFFEELAQAMRGSRWIMTLTLASAVEGALDLLFPKDSRDEGVNLAELDSLKAHIDEWAGHSESTIESVSALKNRTKGAVSFTAEMTSIKRLRLLARQGKITTDEVRSWEKVRHKVAHGKIFSPFSSEENDRLILNLMSLFRRIAGLIALTGATEPPD